GVPELRQGNRRTLPARHLRTGSSGLGRGYAPWPRVPLAVRPPRGDRPGAVCCPWLRAMGPESAVVVGALGVEHDLPDRAARRGALSRSRADVDRALA